MTALSAGAIYVVRKNNLAEIDSKLTEISAANKKQLQSWITEKQRVTSSLKFAPDSADPKSILSAAKQAGALDDAYFGYTDNRYLFLHPVPEGYVVSGRGWFKQALASDAAVITSAYIGASSKKLLITFAEPFGPANGRTGVVGTDVLLENVSQMIADIKPAADSFSFLIDGDERILAYQDPAFTLKKIGDLIPGLSKSKLDLGASEGTPSQVEFNGKSYLLYASKIDGTTWTLGTAISYAEVTQPLNGLIRITVLLSILCLAAAAFFVTFTIDKQLQRITKIRDAFREIASGDGNLARRIQTGGNDELGQIGSAFNDFVDKISTVLSRVQESSKLVHNSSNEIALGNAELAQRTEEQARALEQTSSAMEQITATVQNNAENARQADTLANEAASIAGHGGGVVRDVVKTMGNIDASSRRIVEIITVIDGIAFQTNILALNAAVEAARAGEQGRGFAVVAAEVRTLAQRSAGAAKEIKALIDNSVSQVVEGGRLVQEAGMTIDKLVESVNQVTTVVGEISHASQEQSKGIAEIGKAVSEMDRTTQQNAALVEEVSAASLSLEQQAAELAEVISAFQLAATADPHVLQLAGKPA